MKLRIDWLSIVSRFHSDEEKTEFVQKLQSLLGREWKNYVVQEKSPRNATGTCHPSGMVCAFHVMNLMHQCWHISCGGQKHQELAGSVSSFIPNT